MKTRVAGRTRDLVILLDKMILVISRHWLFAVNWAVALYLALPLLAPWFMINGFEGIGGFVYRVYGPPTCHQLPERSYFLYGPQPDYTLEELTALVGGDVPLRYIGDAAVGFKVAICQRDVAIYTALLFAGVAFGLVRRRIRPVHWKYLLLFLAPMAIDGTGQLVGLWESTWLTRTITGILASSGVVLFLYPYLEEGMRDVQQTVMRQLGLGEDSSSGALSRRDEDPDTKSAESQEREELE